MADSSATRQDTPAASTGSVAPPPAQPAPLTFGAVWRRLGPAGPLAVIAASLPGIGGLVLLGFITWVAHWLRSQDGLGLAVYVLGFAVTSGFAILPTYAQSAVGGWAFGLAKGAPAAVLAVVGGAVIGHAVARRASGDRVMSLINERPKWRAVYEALVGGGFWKTLLIVTLLRLPPNSPFAITNLVMAAARVRYPAFLLGSALGLAPRTVAVVFIGAGLSELDFGKIGSSWLTIASVISAALVIMVIGVIANHAVARVTAAGGASVD